MVLFWNRSRHRIALTFVAVLTVTEAFIRSKRSTVIIYIISNVCQLFTVTEEMCWCLERSENNAIQNLSAIYLQNQYFFSLIKSKQIHQRKIDDFTIFFAFELSSVNPSHAGNRNRFDDLCNYRCLRIVFTVLCSYSITRQIDCHSDTRNNLDQKSSFPSVAIVWLPFFFLLFLFHFLRSYFRSSINEPKVSESYLDSWVRKK